VELNKQDLPSFIGGLMPMHQVTKAIEGCSNTMLIGKVKWDIN
jgi:hypothetical protein